MEMETQKTCLLKEKTRELRKIAADSFYTRTHSDKEAVGKLAVGMERLKKDCSELKAVMKAVMECIKAREPIGSDLGDAVSVINKITADSVALSAEMENALRDYNEGYGEADADNGD